MTFASVQIEELTIEQQEALDRLVSSFDIKHGELAVRLKVYNGAWQEASINPERRIRRVCTK